MPELGFTKPASLSNKYQSGAEFLTQGGGDFLVPLLEDGGIATFKEEADFRLRAGVAEEDASALALQILLRLGHQQVDRIEPSERFFLTDDDVCQ